MDDRIFRKVMGKFATGVTVVTTKTDEGIHGMTANAFMSVSLNPKLITVSIDNEANILHKISRSQKFAVSILSESQQDISMHFAGQTKEERKIDFDYVQNIPIIKDSLASIACDVYESYPVGDHTLYIGKVLHVACKEDTPLTFFGGQYGLYQPVQ
ncbi:MAG TPA: flavin reductase family protein [Bacillota bacterium]|nr:flavin reductase family protein [Bacillota bacterium]